MSFSVTISLGHGQCIREWLEMAGAKKTSLNDLQEKARYYHLSERKICQEHRTILKLFLPANVVEKLKVCTGDSSPHSIPTYIHYDTVTSMWIHSIVIPLVNTSGNPSACGRDAPCHAGQCDYNVTTNTHVCVCPAGLHGDRCQTGKFSYCFMIKSTAEHR